MTQRGADRLGIYVLPGPATDPAAAALETKTAENLGLGSAWLSELQGPFKDAGTICGVMGHVTDRIKVGTSVSHFVTRHPMVSASWGATMQALTGGRFQFGFGRASNARWQNWGVPNQTSTLMEDYALILRRLWRGETVSYDGPAGRYSDLRLDDAGHPGLPPTIAPHYRPPQLLLAAIGPRTLEVAGRSFDGVLLHPALTSDAVGRAREIVHRAAQGAGRDPNEIVVYSQLVVAPDLDDNETELVIGARFAAYFIPPVNSQALFRFNGWDEAPLERLRAEVQRALHANASARSPLSSRELLVNPSRTMPIEWTAAASAAGSTDYCASRMHEYLDAGADRIIIHGTTAPGIAQTIAAFVTQRAGEDFVDA